MGNNHKSTVEIPIPLYEQAKKHNINVSEATRKGILRELENRQLLEKIEKGELRVESAN